MAGAKKYDTACSRPDVVKYMAILVYVPCSAHCHGFHLFQLVFCIISIPFL